MWDPWVFREEGEGLEGANRNKNRSKKFENREKSDFFFVFLIRTALEPTLNPFKTKKLF